jgi:hypothetical protein
LRRHGAWRFGVVIRVKPEHKRDMDRIEATRPDENRRVSTFSRDLGAAIRNVPGPIKQEYCASIVRPIRPVGDTGFGGSMTMRDILDVSRVTGRPA